MRPGVRVAPESAPPGDSLVRTTDAGSGRAYGQPGRDRPTPLVATYAVLVLVLATGAFFAVASPTPEGESRPAVLLLWVVAYGVAAVVLLDGVLRLRLPMPAPPLLVVFVVLAALSVLWSIDPALTLRRSVGLVGTVLVGLSLAQRLRPVDLFDALRRAALIIAVSSLLLYAVGHSGAIDEVHGTLRGVLAHKNSLGRLMAVGLLAAAATALLDRRRVRRSVLTAVPMLVALGLTGSTGGALLAALVLLAVALALVWRRSTGRVAMAGVFAVLSGILVLVAPFVTAEELTGVIGEDPTLTGRDAIWAESLNAIEQRLQLGYGYGTFWSSSEVAEQIRARLHWTVPNAHNGVLDVALDLGLVGAFLAVLVVGGLFVRGLLDAGRGAAGSAMVRLSVASLVVLSTLVESGLFQQNSMLTVLLVTALAVREPGARRLRARRGST